MKLLHKHLLKPYSLLTKLLMQIVRQDPLKSAYFNCYNLTPYLIILKASYESIKLQICKLGRDLRRPRLLGPGDHQDVSITGPKSE